MEFSYFDLIAGAIILLLGLKGILNGFFKELFGLIGIVGGIFIASRVGDSVGQYFSDLIFNFENNAAINFSGFLFTLALFWILMIFSGAMFKKLSSLSGLGPVDKIFGFIVGSSKFFLIAAVIAHASYNIKIIQSTIEPIMEKSFLFPMLVGTGAFIMKIDPVEISSELNATLEESASSIDAKIEELKENTSKQIVDEVQKELQEVKTNQEQKR